MKATLAFDLDDPDDRRRFDMATKGEDAHHALAAIQDRIFRPARKHGYDSAKIEKLMEISGLIIDEDGEEYHTASALIDLLEGMYVEIIQEYELNPRE